MTSEKEKARDRFDGCFMHKRSRFMVVRRSKKLMCRTENTTTQMQKQTKDSQKVVKIQHVPLFGRISTYRGGRWRKRYGIKCR